MPIYLFQHPKTQEVREIVQRMSEEHVFVEKGVKWDRIFTKPQASIDTQISAHDVGDFVKKTKNKNYSLGQMWDISGELSKKREGASGVDEIRVKAETAYKNKTKKDHPHSKKKSSLEF